MKYMYMYEVKFFLSSINYDLNASNQNMMYAFKTFLRVSLLFPIDASLSAKDKDVQETHD